MNVFETKLGQDFLEYQIPTLIQLLQDLVKRPTCLVPPIPVQANPKILRGFFNGLYQPGEEAAATKTVVYGVQSKELKALEEQLRGQISHENWLLVERYCHTLVERDGEELEIAFETGFRSATQLLIAGLTVPGEVSPNEL